MAIPFNPSHAALEQRICEADDHRERLEDVHEFVRQKVRERTLREYLDPSIQSLLDTHFHDFRVELVLKEGPGGSSWKPIMSTIDVMLWTVKADNLEKALEIAGASKSKRTKAIRQLKQVQQYSFHLAEVGGVDRLSVATSIGNDSAAEPPRQRKESRPYRETIPTWDKLTSFLFAPGWNSKAQPACRYVAPWPLRSTVSISFSL